VKTPRNIGAIALLVGLLAAAPAGAETGEGLLWAAPTFDVAFDGRPGTRYGAGVQAGYRHGLADDWDLEAVASWAAFPGDERADLGGLAVGPAYVVDASRWRMGLHASVGVFASPWTRRWPIDAGVGLGMTVEYRIASRLAVGARAEYRRLVRAWMDLDGTVTTALWVGARF